MTVRAIMSRPQSRNVREAKSLARRVKAQHVVLGKDALDSELVWIAVPDDAIASVAEGLAAGQEWKGKTVFHSSGALSSDELQALRERGAKVASVHPMMTFVRSAVPAMHGVPFAIEGDAAAVRLAKAHRRRAWAAIVSKSRNETRCCITPSAASPHRW